MREPLKFFVAKALSKSLAFIPGLRALSKQYLTFSELAADERATDNFQNRVPLARALSKIICWQENAALYPNVAISFLGSITEERVNKLVDNSYAPKGNGALVKMVLAATTLAITFVLINTIMTTSNISLQQAHGDSCSLSALSHGMNDGGECDFKHSTDYTDLNWITRIK